jgi:asparagine synthase (glutamine-hydrolysing)
MCGIAGLWAPRIDAAERAGLVNAMLERLRHRGPNGSAIWQDRETTLGLMRLAIVAPETPASVAFNETGRVRSVVNGEIYNHREIEAELVARRHSLVAGADTLTVPHLYEELGASFPERIDGQFAIAVWDAEERRLVLARDRAGEKPLFIHQSVDAFAFASEPGAIATLPWYRFAPDPGSLSRYLVHGFIAGEDCAFAGIRQLAPGTVLEVDAGGVRERRYWRPWDGLERPAPVEDAPEATRDALGRAVASRIPEDVPFGVFLSGGVDSGLVARLAAEARRARFPTFSLRFTERGYDESAFARRVAESIGTEHHEITLDAREADELLDHVADALDQPLGDPSTLPTWTLARYASLHVPVVLTGEGGDELFAGYPTYLGHRWAARAGRLPEGLRNAVAALAGALRPKHHHLTIPYFVERFLASAALPPFDRHVAWFGTASPLEAPGLLAPALRDELERDEPRMHIDRLARSLVPVTNAAGAEPGLLAYQILDFELYLGGGLLTKVDRCTMDHGMESRAPFLQPDLIRFALGLPERQKLRGRTGKWVLKQAARGLLPDDLLARRKQGFSPPFSAWLRGPLRGAVRSRLSRERVERAGVLDPTAVGDMVEAHLAGRAERSRTIWTLLSLQMWAERQVGARTGTPPPDRASREASPSLQASPV